MLTQVISAFMVRKLTLVNERYKLCQWQEVFDGMLTVVIQRVFEKDVSSFPLFDKVGKMLMLVWEREITNVASVIRTLPPNLPPPPPSKSQMLEFRLLQLLLPPVMIAQLAWKFTGKWTNKIQEPNIRNIYGRNHYRQTPFTRGTGKQQGVYL